jgi:hypothetical protein
MGGCLISSSEKGSIPFRPTGENKMLTAYVWNKDSLIISTVDDTFLNAIEKVNKKLALEGYDIIITMEDSVSIYPATELIIIQDE